MRFFRTSWRAGRRAIASLISPRHLRRVLPLLVLGLSLLLTSCTDYDVQVRFDHTNQAHVTQTIHLGRSRPDHAALPPWLTALEQATQSAHGRVRHFSDHSDQEVELTLPIANGAALVQTFDQMRAAIAAIDQTFPSTLQVQQFNRIVAVRYHLQYDLDLTALGISSLDGQLLFSPGSLLHLGLQVDVPWGFQPVTTDTPSDPAPEFTSDRTIRWQPQPGQRNHLDLQFWLPSPIGIGAIVILIWVGLGLSVRSLLDRIRASRS